MITGMPVNSCKRFDAVTYRTGPTSVIHDTKYSGGSAVQAYYLPIGTPILHLDGMFPEGELSGLIDLRIYWEGSNLGGTEMRLRIIEDGVLANTVDLSYGADSLSVGASVIHLYKPNIEYSFILENGQSESSNVRVDYLQFDQIYHGNILDNSILYYAGSDGNYKPAIKVSEVSYKTMTGVGARSQSSVVTFGNTYLTTPAVFIQPGNSLLNSGYGSLSTTGVIVYLNHVDGSVWSSTEGYLLKVEGYVATPWKPLSITV